MKQHIENDISKPKNDFPRTDGQHHQSFAARDAEPMLVAVSRMREDAVRHFDLAPADVVSSPPKDEKSRAGSFVASGRSERFRTPARLASMSDEVFFPAASGDPKELFDVLLFQLDRIIYLDEIRESLESIDKAISAGNIDKVRSAADECASLSAGCGMFGALASLNRLAGFHNEDQMAGAAALTRQVRKEFERFRFNIRESLKQIAPLMQTTGTN